MVARNSTTLKRRELMETQKGTSLIILLFILFVMSLGLIVAVPVWETQIQREKEEELIFRGKQYVEAVRIYQLKHPGRFPKALKKLVDEKCLRRPFQDPMTQDGVWNVILLYSKAAAEKGTSAQKVLVAPQSSLSSIDNPQIIGVVSSSPQKSFMMYLDQETYDKWLFYYGQDPKKMPEIVYYGQEKKD